MSVEGGNDTAVLIVGGGIVGLSAALFLHQNNVPFILIEKGSSLSALPRARGFSARTMELFRSVGLQDAIEKVSVSAWKQGKFGGARRGVSMLESTPLAEADVKRLHSEADPSPCKLTACPQTLIEPILYEALLARQQNLRFGWELIEITENQNNVTAIAKDSHGVLHVISASWLFAADGARSSVRRALGIERRGIEANRYYLNIFFEADLTDDVKEKTFSQCELSNDKVEGLFLSMNNTTLWSFHLSYDPVKDNPENWDDNKLSALLCCAIGKNTDIKILGRSGWNTRVRVASSYQNGRVFLMGDAAHVMPPWGGFNANTGIADAHNLSWKVAHVLSGKHDHFLLNTYESERQPVAIRNGKQAWLRTDFDARFQLKTVSNAGYFSEIIDYNELHMRYEYSHNGTVNKLRCQSGTRFPHLWVIHRDRLLSTLDLFGTEYVRLGGPKAFAVGQEIFYRFDTDLQIHDDKTTWHSLTGLADNETLLIRPDGFIV
ncbi:FAD-dependent monooxygenase [Pantoea dispersa]|uniref:FAD-dependent monooxygenase n=1 Tax=Pantoea dispersa TaxID=59814 RepID=UPI0021F7F9FF|nr:FAD-dependent monooxygenase [Pantoea dispersa]MCW0321508.1 4-methyl-5-nitrocatechol 5-monooxygenase [Pantoea dispersa]MCW0326244.1 4-methyl-5-nitrocatechol 5-monooxygenase [Pantoea dispersa]MCW0432670.1 4-methyl-5-nitrocatechol 5-monooxygenase [Pantoea dispersa]